MALTAKQQRFVDEYLVDLNATQAAIRAGYSQKTARQVGAENLTKPVIADAVAKAQTSRSDRVQIDSDWVLTRLASEATADLADIYDEDGGLKPVHDWPLIWRQGLVAGIEAVEEFETVDGERRSIGMVRKVKLSDRIKRIELIGKHVDVQAFKDQIEHKGGINLTVNQDDAEL
jgi:phage terminase small subunit